MPGSRNVSYTWPLKPHDKHRTLTPIWQMRPLRLSSMINSERSQVCSPQSWFNVSLLHLLFSSYTFLKFWLLGSRRWTFNTAQWFIFPRFPKLNGFPPVLPALLHVSLVPFQRNARVSHPSSLWVLQSSGSLGHRVNEIKVSIMFGLILGDTNKEWWSLCSQA